MIVTDQTCPNCGHLLYGISLESHYRVECPKPPAELIAHRVRILEQDVSDLERELEKLQEILKKAGLLEE